MECVWRCAGNVCVLESLLGDIGQLPLLQIIARRIEGEVEEQRKAIQSAMGGFADPSGRNL